MKYCSSFCDEGKQQGSRAGVGDRGEGRGPGSVVGGGWEEEGAVGGVGGKGEGGGMKAGGWKCRIY